MNGHPRSSASRGDSGRAPARIRSLLVSAMAFLVPITAVAATRPAPPECLGETATLVGTRRSDDLIGSAGRDVIVGLGGDDFITALGGADLVCAGAGFDFVSAGGGNDLVRGEVGDDTLNGGGGDDSLLGLGDIDALFGEAGEDRLLGGPGTGIGLEGLIGGPGDDHLDGGPGLDVVHYFDAPGSVHVDLGAGVARGHGSDRIIDVEGAGGSNFDDLLVGDEGGNGLFGQEGADTIRGLASGDFASGTYDVLSGDDGADLILGGAGDDVASYGRILSAVTVDLAAGTATGQGRDSLAGVEGVFGSRFDDVLLGDPGDNLFAGDTGDDRITGRAGLDTVSLTDVPGPVTVDLAAGEATGAGVDVLGGIENAWGSSDGDILIGDQRRNELFGFAGDDRLFGGPGDDLLAGGDGPDHADGGAGSDVCFSVVRTTGCESTSGPAA